MSLTFVEGAVPKLLKAKEREAKQLRGVVQIFGVGLCGKVI